MKVTPDGRHFGIIFNIKKNKSAHILVYFGNNYGKNTAVITIRISVGFR